MTTLSDEMAATLKTLTGETGPTNGLLASWLKTETGQTGHLTELWHHFFDSAGVAAGDFNDRANAYLTSEGYTGTLNEKWVQFWAAGGPSGAASFLLLESGDKLILEDGSGNLLLQ